jgi:hypothetical protein
MGRLGVSPVARHDAGCNLDSLPYNGWASYLFVASSSYAPRFTICMMGRRQAVRHRSLEPAFGGSNPPAPVFSPPFSVPGSS